MSPSERREGGAPPPEGRPDASPEGRRAVASPTPEQAAAIVAAIEVAWPKPATRPAEHAAPSPWKWSGRWWSTDRPEAASRRRP